MSNDWGELFYSKLASGASIEESSTYADENFVEAEQISIFEMFEIMRLMVVKRDGRRSTNKRLPDE